MSITDHYDHKLRIDADGIRWFYPPPCPACRRGGADPLCGCTDPIALGPADDDTADDEEAA